jgi:hypothetical protein
MNFCLSRNTKVREARELVISPAPTFKNVTMNKLIKIILSIVAVAFMLSTMVVVFITPFEDIISGEAGKLWWVKVSVVPGILGYAVCIAAILIFSIIQTGNFFSWLIRIIRDYFQMKNWLKFKKSRKSYDWKDNGDGTFTCITKPGRCRVPDKILKKMNLK